MLRITPQTTTSTRPGDAGPAALRLEGTLRGEAVDTLLASTLPFVDPPQRSALVLDVSALRFVDAHGAGAIRELVSRGARLEGCSPLLRELLGSEVSRG